MGNKHGVRNLVPGLGRSRSITRLSPQNYADPAGAPKEVTALIGPNCRWARRGECKDSLGVKLETEETTIGTPTTASPVASDKTKCAHPNSFQLALTLISLCTFPFASPLSLYRPRQKSSIAQLLYKPSITVEFLKFQIPFLELVARSCQRAKLNIYLQGKYQ